METSSVFSPFSNISQGTGYCYAYSKACFRYNIAHFTTAQLLRCFIDGTGIKIQMGNEHGVRALSLGKSSAPWLEKHLLKLLGLCGWFFSFLSFHTEKCLGCIFNKSNFKLNHRITESQNGRGWKGPLGVI